MNNFKFVHLLETKVFTDMNNALLESSQLKVFPSNVYISDIEVTPEGRIKVGSEEKSITRLGFLSYCKTLGIPSNFAINIPEDLLLTNIERLRREKGGKKVVLLERSNGALASIIKAPYSEIPYSDILGRFSERPFINIQMNEQLLKVTFKFDTLKVPGLVEDKNTFYIGDFLLSSLTKDVGLQAVSGLFRTECTNSFIMPILGKVRANYMKGPEKRLNLFTDAFECYDKDLVATVFRNMSSNINQNIKIYQFKYIHDTYSRITSKSNADTLFNIDEDTRQSLLLEATLYLSQVKKARGIGIVPPTASDTIFKLYNVANDITTIAHEKLSGIDTVKAEILGGKILQWMIFSN